MRINLAILTVPSLAILILFNSVSQAQPVVIKGHLEGKFYSWTGIQSDSQTTKFTIKLEGEHWLLRTEYTTNLFWLAGGDGTNVYDVLVDPKASKKPASAAFVFSGDFPQNAYYQVTIPWLAFCSSHFLGHSTASNAIPSVWIQAELDPMGHVCSTETLQFNEQPNLPKTINWVTSSNQLATATSNNFLRIEGVTTKELQRRLFNYMARIPVGKILGDYRVLEATNIYGWVLPLKFQLQASNYLGPNQIEFEQKVLDEMSKTNDSLKNKHVGDTYLVGAYTGIVDEISAGTGPVGLPDPARALSVTDYRLASKPDGIDYVSYLSKQWKPQIDEELLKLLEVKKKNPPHNLKLANPINDHLQDAVRVIVPCIFFAPIIVWCVRKLKSGKSTKTKGKL